MILSGIPYRGARVEGQQEIKTPEIIKKQQISAYMEGLAPNKGAGGGSTGGCE